MGIFIEKQKDSRVFTLRQTKRENGKKIIKIK
jgi:hypothetical protein